jgi:hypothetical protein
VAFCAAAGCAALSGPSTESRWCAAHSRSWLERRDHAVMMSLSSKLSSNRVFDGSYQGSRLAKYLVKRVELRGLEPLTPTLPVWCATSCAIAP